MKTTKDLIVQNIKLIKIMKASAYTDKEVADTLGLGVKEFIDEMFGDDYLKEVYEKAQEKLVSEIEKQFLENVLVQLQMGDNTDAKWILERTSKKYQKKDQVEVSVRSIDDIIRGE